MKKNLLAGLAMVAALFASEQAAAQTAGNVIWPLTRNNQDSTAARSAGLTAGTPTFKKYVISNGLVPTNAVAFAPYSSLGQAFGVQADGGGWSSTAPSTGPGSNPRRTYYEQFSVTATAPVRLDSLILKASVVSSANGKMSAIYSLSNFVSDSVSMASAKGPTGILPATADGSFGTGTATSSAGAVLPQYVAGVANTFRFDLTANSSGVVLSAGQTLTVRLYFGVGSTNLGRYVLLKNVNLKSLQPALATKVAVAKQGLNVYPNPAQNNLQVAHPAAKKGAIVSVYAFNGQKVASFVAQPNTTSTDVRLSALTAGMYMVEYSDGEQRITAKIVKQ